LVENYIYYVYSYWYFRFIWAVFDSSI
jgi:hypothetical protein